MKSGFTPIDEFGCCVEIESNLNFPDLLKVSALDALRIKNRLFLSISPESYSQGTLLAAFRWHGASWIRDCV